jgi:hypothetical protein
MRGHTSVSSLMQGGNPVKHDVIYFKKLAYTKVNHIRSSLYGVKLLIRYLLTSHDHPFANLTGNNWGRFGTSNQLDRWARLAGFYSNR